MRVVGLYVAGRAPVYNITVADAREYYANGVLVHNCDAMVWGLTELSTAKELPVFKARVLR